MPVCKNDPKKSYKGIEPSPKGKGYCAHAEKVNTKRKGNDGNYWIVKKSNNGIKKWIKDSNKKENLTSEQLKTLDLIKKDLKNELKKIDVKLFIVKNKPINNIYLQDYLWDFVKEKLGNNYLNEKFLIVNLKMDGKNILLDNGGINIQHNNINYNTKKQVIEIMNKMFGKKYKWNGSTTKTIYIKL
jgi:hypothetical protein